MVQLVSGEKTGFQTAMVAEVGYSMEMSQMVNPRWVAVRPLSGKLQYDGASSEWVESYLVIRARLRRTAGETGSTVFCEFYQIILHF